MTRVALLTRDPGPEQIPPFNALVERIDLRVLFLRERNPDRPFRPHREELRFDWAVLPGIDFTSRRRWIVLTAASFARCAARKPS